MLKKTLVAVIVILLLYTVGGFFILPAWLRPTLEEKLSQALGRTVAVREIAVNPFVLSVDVKGFSVSERGGGEPFVSFDELSVDAQARSILRGGPIVREVTLTGPRVSITRLDAKRYNFSDLLEKKGPQPPEKEEKRPLRFSVGNIVVKNGSVRFNDLAAHTTHEAVNINLAIPFVSNLDEFLDVFVQPRFSAKINGTQFTLLGETKPFKDSLETVLDLDLEGISLPYYMGYLPPDLRLGVASGTLDVKTRLTYVQYKGKKPLFTVKGGLALHGLTLKDKGGNGLASLKEARVAIAPSPLTEKWLHLSQVKLDGPEVFVSKGRNGQLNLTSIAPPSKKKPEPGKPKTDPFVVSIDQFSLAGGAVSFTDASKASPVKLAIDQVSLEARGLSTKPDAKGTLELSSRINGKCSAAASASLALKPVTCDAKLDVSGFEPAWVQPYFTENIRIMVTRGSFSTTGRLGFEKKSQAKPRITFDGSAALKDFASLDKASSDDFLRCRSLSLDKIRFAMNPGSLDIGTVAVKGLYSRILVAKDGTVNLATIVKKDTKKKAGPAAPAKEEKQGFGKISVGTVVVDNAHLVFRDKSVPGGYSADLSRLTGTVRGISSSRTARAGVKLSGVLDNSAPVLITGTINPFKENLYVNLHTSLKDLDLSPMTPYSGKFVGYAVEKGKLSLDLTYLIDHKALDSRNNVFIDQFNFGRGIDSPTATKLPVRFAVALLRDADGRIDLKIPVKGRTDDPKFSVWGVVVTVLKNLVVKAATSPFLLLEAMYPGASQSNAIEFADGRADLPDNAASRLATVLKILGDKPGLKLEVRGYADPDKDTAGLADWMFERKVKAQKLKDLIRGGKKGLSLDDVTLTQEEYPGYLKKAYAAENYPDKPRNLVGLPASLPPAEMEKLMRAHIRVAPEDLRLLAVSRAQKVQEYLLAQKADPSRIFLVDAGGAAPESRAGVKSTRADLVLK